MFPLNKKNVIILILVWAVALFSTILVTFVMNSKTTKKVDNKKEKVSNPYISSYLDSIDENDLETKEIEEENCTYLEVHGLKDKNIENKINQDLKEKVVAIYKKIKNREDFYISSMVNYNANGLLSISIYGWEYNSKNDTDIRYYDSLNVVLETGESFSLKDIFWKEENIYKAYAKEATDTLLQYYSELEHWGDNVDEEMVQMEDTVLKNVYDLKKGNYVFGITYRDIIVIVNDLEVRIDIGSYFDSITYFKKYKKDSSIFDGSFKGKEKIYLFGDYPEKRDYYYADYESNKTLLDVRVIFSDDQETEKGREDILNYINIPKELEDFQKDSLDNQFRYFHFYGYAYYLEDYQALGVYYEKNICSVDRKKENDMIESVVSYYHPSKNVGLIYETMAEFLQLKGIPCQVIKETYLIKNGKKITLDNLFKKGYDYESVLKDHFFETYESGRKKLSEKEKKEIWKEVTYNLEGSVYIVIRYKNEESAYVYLDEFDREYLTI